MGRVLEFTRECYVCEGKFKPITTNGGYCCQHCNYLDEQQAERDYQEWEKGNAVPQGGE